MKSGRRHAAKIDNNQNIIVNELKANGFSVYKMARIGKGFPDLLVGFENYTFLVEVKNKNGKLTEPQEVFIRNWKGEIFVIHSYNEFVDKLNNFFENKKSKLAVKKKIKQLQKEIIDKLPTIE